MEIDAHAEKQTFLKVIYEGFYHAYNPKAADRLGVIYTPGEIVRFMVRASDWLCREHFGRGLVDPGVEILDPATGTGTFVCELLEFFRGQPELARKYREEVHANEVAILPYYVANLNIEATYAEITGQFAEYPNLVFADTLDMTEGLGDEGVVAFVTNRSFLDSRTFDGFRRDVAERFGDLLVVDLGGDVRANPKLSGTKHNVFGIQTGVAIAFFVRGGRGGGIRYLRRPEDETARDKLAWLAGLDPARAEWERVVPGPRADWIGQVENEWDDLIPVADKRTKAAKVKGQERAVFKLFSFGLVTNRDDWMYDLDAATLSKKTEFLINCYEGSTPSPPKFPGGTQVLFIRAKQY